MPHILPLPSASLARQWSSWRCVWGHYHVGILPCGPVSKGRGSCSASVCHSTCCLCTPHLVATTHAWHHLNQINVSWSHQTTGHGSRLPSGTTFMQTNLMQCAAYGLSTDWLIPHPFNLCNAGSTHTSISQTQPLDMMLSTCTQLLWSTMARPVLSGTCSVKPLYALGHRAAAQFLGLGNLLIA